MSVVFAYFVVGLPVSYICGFALKLGVPGLILGRITGKFVQVTLYSWLVYNTNWDNEVQRAALLVQTTSHHHLKLTKDRMTPAFHLIDDSDIEDDSYGEDEEEDGEDEDEDGEDETRALLNRHVK